MCVVVVVRSSAPAQCRVQPPLLSSERREGCRRLQWDQVLDLGGVQL